MHNAFYYEETYYLLPEQYVSYDAFYQEIIQGPVPVKVQAVALRENHGIRNFSVIKGRSMAPYFLLGYNDMPVTVVIENAADVYPAYVEIYSQEEYNARLREKILEICPGCLRYKPLSNRVQSLNGHFEEMSLDGVCLYRQETKPTPRIFHEYLFSFGGFFRRFDFATLAAPEMQERLKDWFYVRYAGSELDEADSQKKLMLTARKNELILPLLTDAISEYLYSISDGKYRIALFNPVSDKKAWIESMLSSEKQENFRKDCKKYGVSIGVLEYAPEAAEKVCRTLQPLLDHFWMFPLSLEPGKEYYLLADTTYVLKELRYRAPLLQTCRTQMEVFGQYGNHHYEISFAMPRTEL